MPDLAEVGHRRVRSPVTVVVVAPACSTCGLDPATIAAPDAAVAIRGYVRRYRSELALPDDADTTILSRRPDGEPHSALELTARVAALYENLTAALSQVLSVDSPSFAAWASSDDEIGLATDPDAVLQRLSAACESLATVLDRARGDDWGRMGRWADGERNVLDAARQAVHEGSHALKDVRRIMR